MSATVTDLLMSAEYVLSQGNSHVVLCERGVRGFDTKTARNLFDVATVAAVKQLSHLPIIVDPSHATGQPALDSACALAGVAAGADGVHIEVHDRPEEAKSDGAQALLPEQYRITCRADSAVGRTDGKDRLTSTEGTYIVRRPLIAGNWKMNLTRSEAVDLARQIAAQAAQRHQCRSGDLPTERVPGCGGRSAARVRPSGWALRTCTSSRTAHSRAKSAAACWSTCTAGT